MVIYTQKAQVLEKDKIFIEGYDCAADFWRHHTWNSEQFDLFAKYAHLYPLMFDKINNCNQFTCQDFESLTEDEKMAYRCYFSDPIVIQYDSDNDQYYVVDGRHRVAVLMDAGVELKFNVDYAIEFTQSYNLNNAFIDFYKEDLKSNDLPNTGVDIQMTSSYKDILFNIAILDTAENRYWIKEHDLQFIKGQSLYPDITNSYMLLGVNPNEWDELSQNIPPDDILMIKR